MHKQSTTSRSPARLLVPRRRTPPGASPGTLVPDPSALPPVIELMAYGKDGVHEQRIEQVDELLQLVGRRPITWVNVQGLGDVELIRRLGEVFDVHQLALEDVVNVHQRPRVDEYEDHLFIVCRMPGPRVGSGSEQISMFLGKDYLLTFQERPGDCFDVVRKRIRRDGTRLRQAGPDYLAYTLLDAVTDSYFPLLEEYGEMVEALEENVLSDPRVPVVRELQDVKRALLGVRRAVWPLRDLFTVLVREDSAFVSEETHVYFRDCYDHVIQLMDVIETYREIASGLVDIYLSSLSARMNEIMKVLTIIATIFIPLGFIASLYGMNFNRDASPWNMPELDWHYGYPYAVGLMIVVAVGLLYYFRRKRWIGWEESGSPGTARDRQRTE
jgi:magnesium transporter